MNECPHCKKQAVSILKKLTSYNNKVILECLNCGKKVGVDMSARSRMLLSIPFAVFLLPVFYLKTIGAEIGSLFCMAIIASIIGSIVWYLVKIPIVSRDG